MMLGTTNIKLINFYFALQSFLSVTFTYALFTSLMGVLVQYSLVQILKP